MHAISMDPRELALPETSLGRVFLASFLAPRILRDLKLVRPAETALQCGMADTELSPARGRGLSLDRRECCGHCVGP
jgi:hypothetical protein